MFRLKKFTILEKNQNFFIPATGVIFFILPYISAAFIIFFTLAKEEPLALPNNTAVYIKISSAKNSPPSAEPWPILETYLRSLYSNYNDTDDNLRLLTGYGLKDIYGFFPQPTDIFIMRNNADEREALDLVLIGNYGGEAAILGLEEKVSWIAARFSPSLKEIILPDNTSAVEIIADSSLFPFRTGTLIYKGETIDYMKVRSFEDKKAPFSLFYAQKGPQIVFSNNPRILKEVIKGETFGKKRQKMQKILVVDI